MDDLKGTKLARPVSKTREITSKAKEMILSDRKCRSRKWHSQKMSNPGRQEVVNTSQRKLTDQCSIQDFPNQEMHGCHSEQSKFHTFLFQIFNFTIVSNKSLALTLLTAPCLTIFRTELMISGISLQVQKTNEEAMFSCIYQNELILVSLLVGELPMSSDQYTEDVQTSLHCLQPSKVPVHAAFSNIKAQTIENGKQVRTKKRKCRSQSRRQMRSDLQDV